MTTECTTERLEFERFRRQRVVGRFDGGELGSDGGGLLLRELALRTGLFRRLSACFRDHRDPQRTQHPVEVLVAARVLGLALGCCISLCFDKILQIIPMKGRGIFWIGSLLQERVTVTSLTETYGSTGPLPGLNSLLQ